jgi:UDP-2,3-diacylglucosamine pyrophosphatase LpxH
MKGRLDKNLLVISDLHLGEDLKPTEASVSYLRRLATLERELVRFLTHFTGFRISERPWRLVVNGDMVDFMSVLIMPTEGGSEEERRYGLGHGERQSLFKLDRVIERHDAVFRALGRFVAAGNELVMVVGNHDVEFHFECVRMRLAEALVQRGAAAERIRFCPWFYYEEEVVYVEHGHQYDEYCSFDYQLHPVERDGITLSLAHAGIRYFTNLVPEMDPHDGEAWGLADYFKWAWAQGARGVARLTLFYAGMIRNFFAIWSRLTDRAADAARAEKHRVRLRALAGEYRLAVEKVEAIDGLRRAPVLKSVFKILVALFLDRLLLGLVAVTALAIALGVARGWWRVGTAVGVVAAAVVVNQLLARARLLDSATLLRRAPEAIGRIVRAPFIVFGHSHKAESRPLPSGGTYFNTGSWLHDGERPAFTHLIISGDEEPRAELRQWGDGGSTPLP